MDADLCSAWSNTCFTKYGNGFLDEVWVGLSTDCVCVRGGGRGATNTNVLRMATDQCVLSGMERTTSGAGTEMMEEETDRAQNK